MTSDAAILSRLDRLEAKVDAGLEHLAAEVAELRQAAAGPSPAHDPVRWRRAMLQRLWRGFYGGMTRSGAASAIAQDWAAYACARRNERPAIGRAERLFDELTAQGVRLLSARAIREELSG